MGKYYKLPTQHYLEAIVANKNNRYTMNLWKKIDE